MHVRKGEVFGFGPQRAGKTTLIRMLGCIPYIGRSIDGIDPAQTPFRRSGRRATSRIGPTYEKLTAVELLVFCWGIYGLEETLLQSGERSCSGSIPWHVSNQLIEGFSHGMKQRLTLRLAAAHPAPGDCGRTDGGLDQEEPGKSRMCSVGSPRRGALFFSAPTLDVAQEAWTPRHFEPRRNCRSRKLFGDTIRGASDGERSRRSVSAHPGGGIGTQQPEARR